MINSRMDYKKYAINSLYHRERPSLYTEGTGPITPLVSTPLIVKLCSCAQLFAMITLQDSYHILLETQPVQQILS